jgi:hypothetical protein
MILTIPVSQEFVRSFKDPHRPNIRIMHCLIEARHWPPNVPLEPDPRVPRVKGPVVKKISSSLKTNDGRFHLLNRGITLSVKSAEFDNQRSVLRLSIPDRESYGIIDGGHTDHAVVRTVQALREEGQDDPLPNQYLHVEILSKIEDDLADIAEARNYSIQLKPWSLAAYREKFDWFLEALGDDYRKYIKISENDEQPIGVLDLVQLMCAVNPVLNPPNSTTVNEAYKNAGKCLSYFVDDKDQYQFRSLAPICRDVVRLYDYVRFNWKDAYNTEDDAGRRGRLGARNVMHQRKRNRTALTTYYFLEESPVQGDLPVEKGFAIPVISSFRALLELRTKKQFGWYTDPFKYFNEHGSHLVKYVMTANDQSGNDPHQVGRDAQVYTSLYSEVRRWYLEGKVARLEARE